MSRIKEFGESEEEARQLVAVLEALIEHDRLQDAALGIAKKVIADRGDEKLSPKQKAVYKNVIEPMFSMSCDTSDCDQSIPFSDMPDAIANNAMGESVLCDICQHYYHSMSKDD